MVNTRRIRSATLCIGLAVVCSLICCSSECQAQTGSSSSTAEWTRYELAKGSFSVMFPIKPTEDFKSNPSSLDLPIEMYIYVSSTEHGSFVAMYTLLGEHARNWNEGAAESFYEGIWKGVASGIDEEMGKAKLPHRAVVKERRKIAFSGHDGREINFVAGPFQGRVLATRLGRHAFSAMAMRLDTTPAEYMEKFLTSFTINQTWLDQNAPAK